MRKILIWMLLLAVMISGCAAADTVQQSTADVQPATTDAADGTSPVQQIPDRPLLPTEPVGPDWELTLGAGGAERRNVQVAVSSLRYVTAPEQLPAGEAFSGYDAAYFESGALILVTQTVNNGSTQLSIGSVTVTDGVATVHLEQDFRGDMVSPVMTTWLLWAEVEAGLELEWVLDGPQIETDTQRS